MPTIYQKDLHVGSTYTRGIAKVADTRASITTYLTHPTLGDARSNLKAAADGAITQHGTTHPDNVDLLARYVTAEWVGPEKSKATIYYSQAIDDFPVGNVDYADVDATRVVRVRDFAAPEAAWTSGTTSDVIFQFNPATGQDEIAPRIIEKPVITVALYAELSNSPLSDSILGQIGKINDASYDLGGRSWPANEVRFDGAKQKVVIGGNTATFYVTYFYTMMQGGWWLNKPIGPGTQTVERILAYGTADLAAPTL